MKATATHLQDFGIYKPEWLTLSAYTSTEPT